MGIIQQPSDAQLTSTRPQRHFSSGLSIHPIEVKSIAGFKGALDKIADAGVKAISMQASGLFFQPLQAIARLAVERRLPGWSSHHQSRRTTAGIPGRVSNVSQRASGYDPNFWGPCSLLLPRVGLHGLLDLLLDGLEVKARALLHWGKLNRSLGQFAYLRCTHWKRQNS
jgi:hypothetical protein